MHTVRAALLLPNAVHGHLEKSRYDADKMCHFEASWGDGVSATAFSSFIST
jgi:hypothetical protein